VPTVSGIGIDIDADVAALARRNLLRWDIADRFAILTGDVRRMSGELGGAFDLVMLLNNIYYFPPSERVALFALLRSLLSPVGALVVVTATAASTVAIRAFDLVLRSTEGCWGLVSHAELTTQLRESGFGAVRHDQLVPGQSLDAFLAT
jgi:spermidine synthase